MDSSRRLSGVVALVTGGGAGQGQAVAIAYGREGASVAVNDIDADAAQLTADRICRDGGRALAVPGDVSDLDSVRETVAAVRESLGTIRVLYNNAAVNLPGEGGDGTVTSLRLDAWDRVLAVNLTGVMLTCREVLPGMVAEGSGRIINVSSVTAFLGVGSHAYTAAKGGVISLTRAIAFAYSPQVTANVICPGTIRTPMTDKTLADPARLSYWQGKVRTGAIGQPDDIVGLATYLASDESRYMTGSVLVLDGGATIH
jgi:NAD(P)-dependent dehydrogenase (short-subunit alcohol dehydrogenase family)